MSRSNDPGDEVATLETIYQMSSARSRSDSVWPARRASIAFLALVALVGWLLWSGRRDGATVDALHGLPDGVVAADTGTPHTGGPWLVTSGTLLMRDGMLWSGLPDEGPPDPVTGRTGSAVLRAVTTARDFDNVTLHVEWRVTGLTTTNRTPERAWDGVHVFLRYAGADDLYVVDLARRDGVVTIKRKTPPLDSLVSADGPAEFDSGAYTVLGSSYLPTSGDWHRADVTVRDTATGVEISLAVDGRTQLTTVDLSKTALHSPGGVGIRGDNAEFVIRSFVVHRNA
ncbi:MAG: hypothetical protein JWM93_2054 [Frankiales bacterium]|nr:hypothetical protein [Frankiales bacterium]